MPDKIPLQGEGRFELALKGSSDGFWDWNVETNEVTYSARFKELLGYGIDEFKDVFESFESHLHPEDHDRVLQEVDAHVKQRVPYDIEYRLRTKTGDYRWFRARGQAIWNTEGRPTRMAGSLTDMTDYKNSQIELEQRTGELEKEILEHRRTEEKLSESQQQFEQIFEEAPVGYHELDLEGRIHRINRTELEILGYAYGEMIHRFVWEFTDDPETVKKSVMAKLSGAQPPSHQLERTYRRKDGTPVEVLIEDRMLKNRHGEIVGIRSTLQDITGVKHAEEAVEEERNLLRTLIDMLPMRIFVKDRQSRFRISNISQTRILGAADPEEVIGKTTVEFVPGEQSEKSLEDDRRVIETGEPMVDKEEFAINPDGTKRWSLTTKVPLRDTKGRIVGIVGSSLDITDRKKAAEEIAARNRDLEILLYVISHDLREPLRAIENFSQLVHDRYGDQVDEKGRDFLSRVVRGAQRMDALLDDILLLSRAQRMEEPSEEIPAQSIVEEVLQRLERRIQDSEAKLSVSENLPTLRVNRTFANQAVYNLVSNALKFVKPGEAPDIEIAEYAPDEPGAMEKGLVVRDRGPGVPREHRERVFQLFQRAVGREIEGTGAGLAIVQQIARRHGGDVWVNKRPGGGSEFVITFGS